jgi:peptidoglycan LD-endopeptidase CwlK
MPKTTKKEIWVSKVNGIDKRLTRISDILEALPQDLRCYVDDVDETFVWRVIARNDVWNKVQKPLRSAHSYGIAVDIRPTDKALHPGIFDYWAWHIEEFLENGRFNHPTRLPTQIVEIFENEGFIWGGKWFHFDPMHFEYRPELLAK